jgi:hypothetical protein
MENIKNKLAVAAQSGSKASLKIVVMLAQSTVTRRIMSPVEPRAWKASESL